MSSAVQRRIRQLLPCQHICTRHRRCCTPSHGCSAHKNSMLNAASPQCRPCTPTALRVEGHASSITGSIGNTCRACVAFAMLPLRPSLGRRIHGGRGRPAAAAPSRRHARGPGLLRRRLSGVQQDAPGNGVLAAALTQQRVDVGRRTRCQVPGSAGAPHAAMLRHRRRLVLDSLQGACARPPLLVAIYFTAAGDSHDRSKNAHAAKHLPGASREEVDQRRDSFRSSDYPANITPFYTNAPLLAQFSVTVVTSSLLQTPSTRKANSHKDVGVQTVTIMMGARCASPPDSGASLAEESETQLLRRWKVSYLIWLATSHDALPGAANW